MKEDAIDEYKSDQPEAGVGNGGTITNTHQTETTEISITKNWADAGDQDDYRLTADEFAAKVHLYGDGKEVTTAKADVKDNGDGTYTVKYTGLPKKANGQVIKYTVKEDAIAKYESDQPEDGVGNGQAITNTHTPETVDISGVKEWKDDKYVGLKGYSRPESITVNLKAKADGKDLTAADLGLTEAAMTKEVKPDADGNWAFEFNGLPKNLPGAVGKEVTYSVEETPVAGYDASQGELDYDIDNTPIDG